jgi:ribonuclease D
MTLHCIATKSWGQVPKKFSRANAAAEAVKQIQKKGKSVGSKSGAATKATLSNVGN